MLRNLLVGATLVASVGLCGEADATTYVYVGSWEVAEGPVWSASPPNGPLAYTGQEAAALLFGGQASQYVVSTNGSDPLTINFEAWYSVIGFVGDDGLGGSELADDYSSKYLGLYYGPVLSPPSGDPMAAASAYVYDNAVGSPYTNYAFRAVPEPAAWVLMTVGFAALGMAGWRARARAPRAA